MPFQITDLIYRKKNAIKKDEAEFLIQEHLRLQNSGFFEHCNHAVTGKDTYSSFWCVIIKHGTEAFDIVFKANQKIINDYLNYLDSFKMFHVEIRNTMLYSHTYRLLKYDVGAKIHPHIDQGVFTYASATFNLNNDYEGGDFVFFNGHHKVKLDAREGMIWPADYFWVHEVEPITKGARYSTNSFLQQIPTEMKIQIMDYVEANTNPFKMTPPQKDYEKKYKYRIKQPKL